METKQIYHSLAAINKAVGVIGKDRKNEQQGFKFRGIDDVMNELHSLFAEHNVFILPEAQSIETSERVNSKGTAIFTVRVTIRFTFVASDGSTVTSTVIGEGMDSGDKATNKAMSIALKYALLQMFLIPTEETKDPDSETHEIKAPVQIKETPRTTPRPKTEMNKAAFDALIKRYEKGERNLLAKAEEFYIIPNEYATKLSALDKLAKDEPIIYDEQGNLL